MRSKPRYVFDTNVVVRAPFFSHSKPARAFFAALDEGETLVSADVVGKLNDVLGREKFERYEHFGLVYIGDTSAFKKLLEEREPEIPVEEDAIVGSLFERIEEEESLVNPLIGARKFTEGWSSWRVSAMGLLNIGKSEGSQIIQLFGRGVRLKGKNLSLKRSSALEAGHPAHIGLLETLNIFAVEANYMAQFREYLEREGVDPEGYEEISLPIRRNGDFLDEGLYVPEVPAGREFSQNVRVALHENEDIRVNLDLSAKVESARMEAGGVSTATARAGEQRFIEEPYLSMLDWPSIHLTLLEYKRSRGYGNLVIPCEVLRRIMHKRDPAAYNLVADEEFVQPESFAGLTQLRDAVRSILRKYVDRFYDVCQRRWDTENMVLTELTGEHSNFADYTVKIKGSEEGLIEEVEALASRVDGVRDGDLKSLPHVFFDRHLYQPLLKDRGDEVKVSPSGLEPSEEKFVSDLKCHVSATDDRDGERVFLLRNLSRGKGVGFFQTAGFYPDFILWVKYADGSQKVVFVEPHGMRNDDPPPNNDKMELYLVLRDLSDRISGRNEREIFLDSYIISAAPYDELNRKWGGGWTRGHFARKHVLFEDELDTGIPVLLAPRDGLERRISMSYPSSLAHGYRALMAAGDLGAVYREQLRFAENTLAFLASVSLALLREEDRERADLDLKKKWSGGISPGDWREIVQKCSKVFASYRDASLATAIHGLKISSEQKGFGRDVISLIQAKNDFKHDRGPASPEEIAKATGEAQERIRRCMQALDFLADYPLRDAESTGDTLLQVGRDRLLLHPFITFATCPRCGSPESYFVDAWDTKKGTVRLKSFERGHTISSDEISDALTNWTNAG